MDYQRKDKFQTIIRYGTTGNKFYVILRGSVSVLIPQNYQYFDREQQVDEGKKNLPENKLLTTDQQIEKIYPDMSKNFKLTAD